MRGRWGFRRSRGARASRSRVGAVPESFPCPWSMDHGRGLSPVVSDNSAHITLHGYKAMQNVAIAKHKKTRESATKPSLADAHGPRFCCLCVLSYRATDYTFRAGCASIIPARRWEGRPRDTQAERCALHVPRRYVSGERNDARRARSRFTLFAWLVDRTAANGS